MSKLFVVYGNKVPWFYHDHLSTTITENRMDYLKKLQKIKPEIILPYLVLFNHPDRHKPWIVRPDGYGGIEGPLAAWSEDFDARTPENLAVVINQELKRPQSTFVHANPISAVLDFTGTRYMETWSLLRSKYHHDVAYMRPF